MTTEERVELIIRQHFANEYQGSYEELSEEIINECITKSTPIGDSCCVDYR